MNFVQIRADLDEIEYGWMKKINNFLNEGNSDERKQI